MYQTSLSTLLATPTLNVLSILDNDVWYIETSNNVTFIFLTRTTLLLFSYSFLSYLFFFIISYYLINENKFQERMYTYLSLESHRTMMKNHESLTRGCFMQTFWSRWLQSGEGKKEKLSAFSSWTFGCRHVCSFLFLVLGSSERRWLTWW